jgi:hypothetical protein
LTNHADSLGGQVGGGAPLGALRDRTVRTGCAREESTTNIAAVAIAVFNNTRHVNRSTSRVIVMAAGFSALTSVHRSVGPPWRQSPLGVVATGQLFLGTTFGLVAPLWLPQGRFASAWTAWFAGAIALVIGYLYFLVSYPQSHDLVNLVGLPGVAAGLWAQRSYYRRVSDPLTRQQIKWGVVGIAMAIVGFAVWQATSVALAGHTGLASQLAKVAAKMVILAGQIAARPVSGSPSCGIASRTWISSSIDRWCTGR